uniref:sucrose synthase n=1 Tax=Glycine max TaxID=3847 RepID=K7L1W4_SOYBN
MELRLNIGGLDVRSSRDISVDTNDTSLAIILRPGSPITLIETNPLFDRVKSSETIWYIDDDQLVVNFKKQDPDLRWPDIMESWESLIAGSPQLLEGTSIYLVGDSTEINQKGGPKASNWYTPLSTKELLELYTKQTVDLWLLAEGSNLVPEAESVVLESISINQIHIYVKLPNMFNIVILCIRGYFGQAAVLGLPDTGGQVVYILDQVRALEEELLHKIELQGLDVKPQILVRL